jgi:phospholipid/cholesterol/gamma-HCH transport system ATP-binding protein
MNSVTQHTPVIHIEGLCKSFGDNHVLNGMSLDLNEGENLVVLGKSGSGKSVLIKCIIGLVVPDHGKIEVLGNDIIGLSQREMDKVRAQIGFLFQSNALYDSMSVRENLEFPLRRLVKNTTQEIRNKLVTDALSSVGLAHTIDLMPEELSGGMRKRVALARTLILSPKVILYDEPTTGLDPVTGREICSLILDIQKKYHTSSIIISHDMNCVRMTANRIIILINGDCYATGTYDQLKASSDPQIQQFFN